METQKAPKTSRKRHNIHPESAIIFPENVIIFPESAIIFPENVIIIPLLSFKISNLKSSKQDL